LEGFRCVQTMGGVKTASLKGNESEGPEETSKKEPWERTSAYQSPTGCESIGKS